jgi:hypothetical protein
MADDVKNKAQSETPAPGETPNYRIDPVTGHRVRDLANGAIYSLDAGHIIGNPPGGPTTAITTDTSKRYHELRREDRVDRAYRGMMIASQSKSVAEAIEIGTAAQWRLAINDMAGRSSTEAFRAVLQFAELWPSDKAASSGSLSDIGAGFARELWRLTHDNERDKDINEVINAEFTENDSKED